MINPAEHDAKIDDYMNQLARLDSSIGTLYDHVHDLAGDQRTYRGRRRVWLRSNAKVESILQQLQADGDGYVPSAGATLSDLLGKLAQLNYQRVSLRTVIDELEKTWEDARWTRYIEALSSDGHIHRWHGCKTLNRGQHPTPLNWRTDLSGKSAEQAIADLGPRLCSVCFPDAPVEHCRTKSDINREAREAARQAALAAKLAAETARANRQAAREAAPRKVTAATRRVDALQALYAAHQDPQDREVLAAAIEELLPLGRSERWQDALTGWAALVRDTNNNITWAYAQGSVYAANAAG